MRFQLYSDVQEFYRDTYAVLLRQEAQNMILLGNLIIGNEGKDKTGWRDPVNWLMAAVSDERGIQLTALMTPPYNLTLYATENRISEEAIHCLVDGLKGHDIPGVTTEKTLAEAFSKAYTANKGLSCKTIMNQRIYELKAVSPEVRQFGSVRLLEERDMHFFPFWMEAFESAGTYGKADMLIPQNMEYYRYRLSTGKLYVLEVDGVPVSMAGFTREMESSIGVAFVYTPPYYRGRGYATSCVAQISRIALERGFQRCVLYTDLLNPTSNSIYQKIGYVPVCDSLMLSFQ